MEANKNIFFLNFAMNQYGPYNQIRQWLVYNKIAIYEIKYYNMFDKIKRHYVTFFRAVWGSVISGNIPSENEHTY